VGLEGERPVIAVLAHSADLAEIVELALADGGPDHFPVFVLVIAQVDVEDAGWIELAVAIGEGLLAGFAGIVGVPGDAEVVFLDVLE